MVTRSTTLKIVYLSFFIILIILVLVFLYRNYIAADVNVGEGGDRQVLDFGSKVGKKSVMISIEGGRGEIIIKTGLNKYCRSELSGFEKAAKIDGIFSVGNEKLIGISGPVGIHSRTKQYFYLDSALCPQPVAFVKDGSKVYNIYSDQPNFLEADFNGDGVLDFAADFRDYNQNPLADGIREIYLYDQLEHQFHFFRAERFQKKTDCPDCNGEIK